PDLVSVWENRPRLPSGAPDERDLTGKYARVIHAERNAIKKATFALGENISRCILYVTHFPCLPCVRDWICLFGIKTVIYGSDYPHDAAAAQFAEEHGVDLCRYVERSS
ncbi:MAG TPA: deaminase, partial [Bryobacteraceae bacterium]|nr:deaminase [Bryobacteraceae bacterium]